MLLQIEKCAARVNTYPRYEYEYTLVILLRYDGSPAPLEHGR